jgi:hypothetical protein
MIGMLLVTLISTSSVLASLTQEAGGRVATTNPFVGHWVADVSQSRFDSKMPLTAADINIAVNGNIVKLASSFTLASGQTQSETETLRADGTETAGTLTPGIIHVANWVGPRVLALIARKGDQNIALITYEVSADGQTLTARTSGLVEQMMVFRRR